jgi:hypothetical protein
MKFMRKKRQLSGAALTAKMIKTRLTALYPKVKFSVKSDTFSMGDSVDIRWTDGPTQEAVNKITKQYQHGSFDGMQDMYNYEAIDSSLGCNGAKYVFCHRNTSAEYKAKLHAKAEEKYGKLNPNDHSYYQRLADIEKEFFPYREVETKLNAAANQGGAIISGLEMKIIKDVDTRDNSEIYVVKIITHVDDFKSLRDEMDAFGGYYSRFKRGFIFKEDPTEKLKSEFNDTGTGFVGECA